MGALVLDNEQFRYLIQGIKFGLKKTLPAALKAGKSFSLFKMSLKVRNKNEEFDLGIKWKEIS